MSHSIEEGYKKCRRIWRTWIFRLIQCALCFLFLVCLRTVFVSARDKSWQTSEETKNVIVNKIVHKETKKQKRKQETGNKKNIALGFSFW